MQLTPASPSVCVQRLKSLKLGLAGNGPPALGEAPSASLIEMAFFRELTSEVIRDVLQRPRIFLRSANLIVRRSASLQSLNASAEMRSAADMCVA